MYKEYIDQSAKTLSLNVFKGEPNMELFNVLAEGKLTAADVSVQSYIIGASHVVAVNVCYGMCTFYEAFSCVPFDITPDTLVSYKINDIESILKHITPDIAYRFERSVDNYDESKDRMDKLEELCANNNNDQMVALKYNFPKGGGEAIPKTILVVSVNDGSIHVESVHTYPNENTNVFTKTQIQC